MGEIISFSIAAEMERAKWRDFRALASKSTTQLLYSIRHYL